MAKTKTTRKKLALKKTTLRVLPSKSLSQAAGGARAVSAYCGKFNGDE